MVKYTNETDKINITHLGGFFGSWRNPPSLETHLDILRNSDHVWLAVDDIPRMVVGFITAISDGSLSAYIPLLEVLPEYRGKGIGSNLMRHMLDELKGFYMIDLICDEDLVPFYQRFGMVRTSGMMLRNCRNQPGRN